MHEVKLVHMLPPSKPLPQTGSVCLRSYLSAGHRKALDLKMFIVHSSCKAGDKLYEHRVQNFNHFCRKSRVYIIFRTFLAFRPSVLWKTITTDNELSKPTSGDLMTTAPFCPGVQSPVVPPSYCRSPASHHFEPLE